MGRIKAVATEVDHIVPLSKGGPDSAHNKQGLCRECHRLKTLADGGGLGNFRNNWPPRAPAFAEFFPQKPN